MAGESADHISTEGLAALEAELRALETEGGRAIAERIRIEHQQFPRTDKTSVADRVSARDLCLGCGLIRRRSFAATEEYELVDVGRSTERHRHSKRYSPRATTNRRRQRAGQWLGRAALLPQRARAGRRARLSRERL
jgi:hypothetical protein